MGETAQPRLTDVGYIRALLERHGFAFSKKLGQNFLVNPSVCPRMAEACGAAPDRRAGDRPRHRRADA